MLKKLIDLGIVRIGFETEHERDFFEEKYLLNQDIEYTFRDMEDYIEELEENHEVFEIEFLTEI